MIQPSLRRTTILDSQAKALLIAQAALDKQAEGVTILDLRALSNVTDFFVICTAGSSRQVSALQEQIETVLDQRSCSVWHAEGGASAGPSSALNHTPQWMLLDCGDVVVHLLDEEARTLYRLEELWADAPRLPLPPAST